LLAYNQTIMNYSQLLKQISEYALTYYHTRADSKLLYHNKRHTEDMVEAATQIANHYQLNDHDRFIVLAAAWFHDLGYMVDKDHHEEQSALLATNYLNTHNAGEDDIDAIRKCILATKMPQKPVTLLEKIVCDADLFHLGTEDFFDKDKLMMKEYNSLHHADISKLDWRRKTVKFLEAHTYHTDYCQALLNTSKQRNIEELKKKIAKAEEKLGNIVQNNNNNLAATPNPAAQPKPEKTKADRPDKGIETMFRISSSNHQRLSDMADNKAHIMITVNSIILSAIISLLLRKLTEYEYLTIPTVILLCISLLAMTFSILATRPSLPKGIFTRADVDERRVNLLFFGNFYSMPLADYTYGMRQMMEDKDFLYGSLIKDIYAQGVVLGKKYHLLRIAYNIFMFGLIVAVLAFIVASVLYSGKHK
jgi:predicted metal-dependent HD superfamily phosphohydrolase